VRPFAPGTGEDRELRIVQVPEARCVRRLGPGEVKRLPAWPRLLYAYAIGCPACGWVGLHEHEAAGFHEPEGRLVGASAPLAPCPLCGRSARLSGGLISASMPEAPPPASDA
jgi:hypothetical protein